MEPKRLQCFAHGTRGDWEAMCVDLDIVVQGQSLEEVRALLSEAIDEYCEAARHEPPHVAQQLLSRRAPWWVRLKLATGYYLYTLRVRSAKSGDLREGFDLACPA